MQNSGSQVRQGWTAPKGSGSAVTQAGWGRHFTPCSNHHEGELQPITHVITEKRDGLLEEVEQEFTGISPGTGNSSVTLTWMYNPSFGFQNTVCKKKNTTGMQREPLHWGWCWVLFCLIPGRKQKWAIMVWVKLCFPVQVLLQPGRGSTEKVDFRTKMYFLVFFSN